MISSAAFICEATHRGLRVSETSKTVTNALKLLSCFSREQSVFTASELARRLRLPRTSVIRLLASLEAFRLVERDRNGAGFRIGIRAFEIGTLFLAANPLSSLLTDALDRLVALTQCTAYLAVLDRDDVVILTYREGTLPIRFIWQVGDRLPCTTTALGKAILMHMSEAEIDRHVGTGKLRGLTAKSLRAREELDRDLALARKRGWGLAREESHAGLTAVGSAILSEVNYPIAAISISCLDYPPNPKRLAGFAAVVQQVANEVSEKIREYGGYGSSISREALTYLPSGRPTLQDAKRMSSAFGADEVIRMKR
jgi:DNA-binding IclR family transcriptional regulator